MRRIQLLIYIRLLVTPSFAQKETQAQHIDKNHPEIAEAKRSIAKMRTGLR